jgi:hypothetical protein
VTATGSPRFGVWPTSGTVTVCRSGFSAVMRSRPRRETTAPRSPGSEQLAAAEMGQRSVVAQRPARRIITSHRT